MSLARDQQLQADQDGIYGLFLYAQWAEANGFGHVNPWLLDDDKGADRYNRSPGGQLYDLIDNVAIRNVMLSSFYQALATQLSGAVLSKAFSVARVAVSGESTLTGIRLNKAIGDASADAIAERFPLALREVPLKTVGGMRVVDVLTLGGKTLAIESKVGETVLSARIRQELARDWWLLRTGQVDGVIWEFTPSPITGAGGPNTALLNMLKKLGFGIKGP